MKRPSFQFYPADWQANSNLRRCTHAEKGVWLSIMCLMHDSEEYGILRWTLKEIAQAVNCPVATLKALRGKGVLKGAEQAETCEPFIYIPRSGRKEGDPVTLVPVQCGPIWYSSRMVKDEYVRQHRGESSRFGEDRDELPEPKSSDHKLSPRHSPKPPFGDGSSSSSSSSTSVNSLKAPNGTLRESARSARLPSDWVLPEDWGEWALKEPAGWTLEQVQRVAEQFRDYWLAKAGSDARKVDWQATWRTWVRREQSLSGAANLKTRGTPRGNFPSQAERDAENARAKALLFGPKAEVIDV